MAFTASLLPLMTLITPSGTPASSISSAMASGQEGSFSEGLRMKLLPQAMASGAIQSGIMAGKLKGVMPAHTPRGKRTERRSMPPPTWWLKSPFISCGRPQANSTTSSPRVTEPFASSTVLPCSSETRRASAVDVLVQQLLEAEHHPHAAEQGVAAQSGKAALAACTARSTSAALAKATRAGLLARGGVVDRASLAALAGHVPAADEMADLLHRTPLPEHRRSWR